MSTRLARSLARLCARSCRYIAQVLTPATPHLLYGLIDEDADVPLDSAPPLLGVASEVGGVLLEAERND